MICINDSLDYHHIVFSNDIVLLARTNDGAIPEKYYSNYTFYNTEGKQIGSVYDEAYGFYEEYAPVKKDGKWGFIDKEGNCVTGFIFDKATPISEGKAWVIYSGRLGKLNIIEMLQNNIPFDKETLNVDSYEIINDSTNWIEIDADKINVRTEPSTSGYRVTTVGKGEVMPYFEKQENEGYTWYKLNEERWVADKDNEWIIER